MMVYVVMIDDTHSDTEPEVFAYQQDAIDFARKEAHSLASDPSHVEESHIMGWLYYAQYSPDSKIWVLPKSINY